MLDQPVMPLSLDDPAELVEEIDALLVLPGADRLDRFGILALLALNLVDLGHFQPGIVLQDMQHVAVPLHGLMLLGIALQHDPGIESISPGRRPAPGR